MVRDSSVLVNPVFSSWYLHLALQLAIGGATCGRALRLARPDQPAPAPRSLLRLAQPSMQP